MNSFDLGITAISVPADLDINAGSSSMRELATMQEGIQANYLKLSRSLTDPRELLRRIAARLFNRSAQADPFMGVGSKPWITVA